MTTEDKALAMVREEDGKGYLNYDAAIAALCRAIEQHEAFRQEVSDAAQEYEEAGYCMGWEGFERFIIPKPDPLVKALTEINGEGGFDNFDHYAHNLRAALGALGFEIKEKSK